MRANKTRLQILGLIFIVTTMFLATVCWAEKKVDPETFARQGTINRLDKNLIVIDDMTFLFEAGTKFYSSEGKVIGSGYFAPGTSVGYDLKTGTGNVIWQIGKIKKMKK